ncbi:hypothetical protein M427DRAFT_61197 [Gonapodya prolifera JEL478]|uniref:Uncharacterized protein n=1 Tax=Gonapodya prolifera (strain JEL478) TaxID=1344416 RepID=A0A139A321_GONPJ|nr:hypothetical protein M427DRAFT_61197 [Gonapodya prolifera JEL478]|eukprot:KXS11114.1 hypothetical protein M427DRAFT_61197 [Gonapodya prolifera JEL478]
MGRGGTWTNVDGFVKKSPGNDGKLAINVASGEVVIRHPETWQDVLVDFTLPEPNVEIVRLLLAYGAPVTKVELRAARQSNPNYGLLRILESHQRDPLPRPTPL